MIFFFSIKRKRINHNWPEFLLILKPLLTCFLTEWYQRLDLDGSTSSWFWFLPTVYCEARHFSDYRPVRNFCSRSWEKIGFLEKESSFQWVSVISCEWCENENPVGTSSETMQFRLDLESRRWKYSIYIVQFNVRWKKINNAI